MKKLLAAACLLSLSAATFAGEEVKDRSGAYAHLGLYNLDLDSFHMTSDDDDFGLGLGWTFNKNWSVEGFYTRMNDMNLAGVGAHADLATYSLDVVYSDTNWIGNAVTHPFIKVGTGKHNDVYDLFTTNIEDEYLKSGIGIQHFANDHAFIRAGFDFLDSGSRGNDTLFYVAMGYFFGSTDRDSAPVVVAPVVVAKDSDNDGVVDANDRCPSTPAGAKVNANGCALDSDNDGVADYKDACPSTAAGVKVDAKGCEIKVVQNVVVDMRLNFDTNAYAIKPEMVSEIAKVANFLKQNSGVNAEIQGHTDSVGSSKYNQGLSERRAMSVKDYMVANFGISADRLKAVGYGEANPIADNSSEEGRALNRRAEAHAKSK